MRQRRIDKISDVKIMRSKNNVHIKFLDGSPGTVIDFGYDIEMMSDNDILEFYNNMLEVNAERASRYVHVAEEIKLGESQIKYSERSSQWTLNGDVLRCIVDYDEKHENIGIAIDDHLLSLGEFGRMLQAYQGWGMRIEFVPEDEINSRPQLEVVALEDSRAFKNQGMRLADKTKAAIAIEAIREKKSVDKIAAEFEIDSAEVLTIKQEFIENISKVFEENELLKLQKERDRLKTELEWLKKVTSKEKQVQNVSKRSLRGKSYELEYACGHGHHVVELVGNEKEREKKAKLMRSETFCPDCANERKK